ncbi:MAG: response regulator [Myxococcota bacterium]
MSGPELALEKLRREFAFSCRTNGEVVWADPACERLVGLKAGDRLTEKVVDGAQTKLAQFLSGTTETPSSSPWDLSFVARGKPVQVHLRGLREEALCHVLGSTLPEEFEDVLTGLSGTLDELAALHRQSEQQQRSLARRNEDLSRLNRELDDSTRGMMSLHDEILEKSDSLRRVNEVKSRLVSNVSHEFRTPLNSILGLTRMLLSRQDGELTDEQEKQLNYIRSSAESLAELVNEILDLSKVEAGKVGLRPLVFTTEELFSALRGVFKPLQVHPEVELRFDLPEGNFPKLETDESKISQILKNFISNALKFTRKGSVSVTARAEDEDVVFAVQDTGIGIAPEDQEKVFEEFMQLDNPLQQEAKGTGLGLALSQRLASILGGRIELVSQPGAGSTFALRIPRIHPEVQEMGRIRADAEELDPNRAPVMVVEDDRKTLFLYERYLRGSGFQVIPAHSINEARRQLERVRPSAIVLDIMLEGETSWAFLQELKTSERTQDIPTLVVTVTNREQRARALGADEFCVKPLRREWLLRRLDTLALNRGPVERVLVIDDDEVSRYLIRKMLSDTPYAVLEAATAAEGLERARTERPSIIFLDFVLPRATAFDVLDALKSDPRTRGIPVIIQTSKVLSEDERSSLARETTSVIAKQALSRELAITRIREALSQSGLGREETLAR